MSFRCEDLLTACVIPNANLNTSCCNDFFLPKTFLTTDGVCFISKSITASAKTQIFDKIMVLASADQNLFAGKCPMTCVKTIKI